MIHLTYHLDFDFRDRKVSDLEQLNKVLSAMKLKSLELENTEGYLAVTRDKDGNLVHQRYGLDRGTLICTPAKDGDCYQLDTVVTDQSVAYDDFLEVWRKNHPGRVVRTVITVSFEEVFAYVIAHHRYTE